MSMAGAKGKPRNKRRLRPDNPAQSAKFIKAARKLRLSGKGDAFERALGAVLGRKPKR